MDHARLVALPLLWLCLLATLSTACANTGAEPVDSTNDAVVDTALFFDVSVQIGVPDELADAVTISTSQPESIAAGDIAEHQVQVSLVDTDGPSPRVPAPKPESPLTFTYDVKASSGHDEQGG